MSFKRQALWLLIGILPATAAFPQSYRQISENELRDKIAGYWIGQLVGNYLGFP